MLIRAQGRSYVAVNAPDRLQAYNQIFPQSDLAAEHMPAAPTVIYGPVGQALAYGVTQGPNGGRLMQSDAAGNLKTFSNGGYETLPVATQLNLVPSRTDTATFTSADIVSPGFTVAVIFLRITAVSGTTPSMTVAVQGKDSQGGYAAAAGGTTFGAQTAVNSVGVAMSSAGNTAAALLPPLFRILATITGTTPSFTWFLDMVYK